MPKSPQTETSVANRASPAHVIGPSCVMRKKTAKKMAVEFGGVRSTRYSPPGFHMAIFSSWTDQVKEGLQVVYTRTFSPPGMMRVDKILCRGSLSEL